MKNRVQSIALSAPNDMSKPGPLLLLLRLVDVVRLLVEVRVLRVGRLQLVRHLGGLRREVVVALARSAADGQRTRRDVGRILRVINAFHHTSIVQ